MTSERRDVVEFVWKFGLILLTFGTLLTWAGHTALGFPLLANGGTLVTIALPYYAVPHLRWVIDTVRHYTTLEDA